MSKNGNQPRHWMESFEPHRPHLLRIANEKISPMLRRRLTPEDIVQETLLNACKRESFFANREDIPLLRKLKIIMEQTLAAMERRYLQSKKRDIFRDAELYNAIGTNTADYANGVMQADSSPGPLTYTARQERIALLHRIITGMPEADRRVLELRILRGHNNKESADCLGISEKNASIRFVRAIQRLQAELSQYTQIS